MLGWFQKKKIEVPVSKCSSCLFPSTNLALLERILHLRNENGNLRIMLQDFRASLAAQRIKAEKMKIRIANLEAKTKEDSNVRK